MRKLSPAIMTASLIISVAILVTVTVISGTMLAAQEGVLKIPEQQGYVSDYAQVVDAKTELALTYLLSTLEKKYHSRIAILTVESIAPATIEGYATAAFRQWQLGPNDLLFLVAIKDGHVYLEPGERLGRRLTDEQLRQIMDEKILPAFSEGNFSKGILQGTVALVSAIKSLPRRPQIPVWVWVLAGAALLTALVLLIRL